MSKHNVKAVLLPLFLSPLSGHEREGENTRIWSQFRKLAEQIRQDDIFCAIFPPGLDPVGIAETRSLIKKLNKEGKTVIMASHLLDEVEKVCSHVAILQKGVLIAHGHVDEILINEDIVEIGSENIHQLLQIVQGFPGASSVKMNERHVEIFFPSGEARLEQVNQHCFEKGMVLNHLRLRRKSLETKFFELTQKN